MTHRWSCPCSSWEHVKSVFMTCVSVCMTTDPDRKGKPSFRNVRKFLWSVLTELNESIGTYSSRNHHISRNSSAGLLQARLTEFLSTGCYHWRVSFHLCFHEFNLSSVCHESTNIVLYLRLHIIARNLVREELSLHRGQCFHVFVFSELWFKHTRGRVHQLHCADEGNMSAVELGDHASKLCTVLVDSRFGLPENFFEKTY